MGVKAFTSAHHSGRASERNGCRCSHETARTHLVRPFVLDAVSSLKCWARVWSVLHKCGGQALHATDNDIQGRRFRHDLCTALVKSQIVYLFIVNFTFDPDKSIQVKTIVDCQLQDFALFALFIGIISQPFFDRFGDSTHTHKTARNNCHLLHVA